MPLNVKVGEVESLMLVEKVFGRGGRYTFAEFKIDGQSCYYNVGQTSWGSDLLEPDFRNGDKMTAVGKNIVNSEFRVLAFKTARDDTIYSVDDGMYKIGIPVFLSVMLFFSWITTGGSTRILHVPPALVVFAICNGFLAFMIFLCANRLFAIRSAIDMLKDQG